VVIGFAFSEGLKKTRYVANFLRKRLVHTNLQILYECNFRCRICDYWKKPYRDRPRLTAAQTRAISAKLNQIGPQVVSIGGGEPLLHPELVGIVKALSRYHFPVMICNGWYVTPNSARALFQAGMHEVSISVDYADPERHDQQRGRKGAFDRALRALRVLLENRVHPHQRVHMISVVMDDNLDDVERLLVICERLGVTYLVTLYSDCRGSKEARCARTDVSRHLLALKEKYSSFVALRGYLSGFSRAVHEGGILPCYTGKNLCNIDCQGQVSLCIDRMDDPVGNILAEEMETIRRKLLQAYRNNPCRGCWTSCRGSIETLMYGDQRVLNLWDYHRLTRPVAFTESRN
jgi:MoaA/NifB/PqqE/SkfB family radical SAM enzyme